MPGRRRRPDPLTQAERVMLRLLVRMGGRDTVRPEGGGISRGMFERAIVQTLHSLQGKGLVRVDDRASRRLEMEGRIPKYLAIVAEITELGRDAGAG